MSIPIGRLSAAAAFVLLSSSTPATSLAYPVTSPAAVTGYQTTGDNNPLRSLLNVVGDQNASLWAALDGVYSNSFVETDCQQPC